MIRVSFWHVRIAFVTVIVSFIMEPMHMVVFYWSRVIFKTRVVFYYMLRARVLFESYRWRIRYLDENPCYTTTLLTFFEPQTKQALHLEQQVAAASDLVAATEAELRDLQKAHKEAVLGKKELESEVQDMGAQMELLGTDLTTQAVGRRADRERLETYAFCVFFGGHWSLCYYIHVHRSMSVIHIYETRFLIGIPPEELPVVQDFMILNSRGILVY
jgi:hypothetical protein